jgi:hypothetical protein
MRKIIALSGLAALIAATAWGSASAALGAPTPSAGSSVLAAGAVFTLALAVLIRD